MSPDGFGNDDNDMEFEDEDDLRNDFRNEMVSRMMKVVNEPSYNRQNSFEPKRSGRKENEMTGGTAKMTPQDLKTLYELQNSQQPGKRPMPLPKSKKGVDNTYYLDDSNYDA